MTEPGGKVAYRIYDQLCAEVRGCQRCPRMQASARVLSRGAGLIDAPVMFIGEAPGRLGADSSEIPFHGDKAGENFEELLSFAGLTRHDIFVTNAVLCNPKDEKGNNSTPNRSEIENCATYLRRQIDVVNPDLVVTLGGVALRSAGLVAEHGLTLAGSVRSAIDWYGRTLIPLYHPGQRAMIQRMFLEQVEDYKFVGTQLRRGARQRSSGHTIGKLIVGEVVREIVDTVPGINYFALHKLFYLLELEQVRKRGHQLTNAFFVRQKDGPYCVDLHPNKLKKAMLSVFGSKELRVVPRSQDDLFGKEDVVTRVPASTRAEIRDFLAKNAALDNRQLKSKAYLSSPMRQILKDEKKTRLKLYNVPIDLSL